MEPNLFFDFFKKRVQGFLGHVEATKSDFCGRIIHIALIRRPLRNRNERGWYGESAA
jgi:hypothetical protein